eukprot:TRINITY_DN5743_c0_g1_i3.p1 TRINITY_DN5743_c0_g1~~TRINITY_DN5743_c0_g1_i3.p1  ORF type:complete len:320 (-),score=68.16 TRINITY_DN5743_c0_g1_i3:126-1085(-)
MANIINSLMSFLTSSSAGASFLAGALIMICWLLAIHDNVLVKRKCGGCIKYLHNGINDYKDANDYDSDYRDYLKLNKDVYVIAFTLSIICGVLWLVTAALAFVKALLQLIVGIVTTIIFICTFVPLVDRMRFNQQCSYYIQLEGFRGNNLILTNVCHGDNDRIWTMKHMYTSYELFWGSSMACFILAAYQIICAIGLVYREEMLAVPEKVPEHDVSPRPIVSKTEDDTGKPKKVEDIEVKAEVKAPAEETKKVEMEQVPEDEAVKSFRMAPPDEALEPSGQQDGALKSFTRMTKRGEVTPPKESPVPQFENPNFSLNNI